MNSIALKLQRTASIKIVRVRRSLGVVGLLLCLTILHTQYAQASDIFTEKCNESIAFSTQLIQLVAKQKQDAIEAAQQAQEQRLADQAKAAKAQAAADLVVQAAQQAKDAAEAQAAKDAAQQAEAEQKAARKQQQRLARQQAQRIADQQAAELVTKQKAEQQRQLELAQQLEATRKMIAANDEPAHSGDMDSESVALVAAENLKKQQATKKAEAEQKATELKRQLAETEAADKVEAQSAADKLIQQRLADLQITKQQQNAIEAQQKETATLTSLSNANSILNRQPYKMSGPNLKSRNILNTLPTNKPTSTANNSSTTINPNTNMEEID